MKREGGEPLPSLLCGFDGPLLTPLNVFSSCMHTHVQGGREDCGCKGGGGGVGWGGKAKQGEQGVIGRAGFGAVTRCSRGDGDLNTCSPHRNQLVQLH